MIKLELKAKFVYKAHVLNSYAVKIMALRKLA